MFIFIVCFVDVVSVFAAAAVGVVVCVAVVCCGSIIVNCLLFVCLFVCLSVCLSVCLLFGVTYRLRMVVVDAVIVSCCF